MEMGQRDYDSRTALHVAAAEGKPHLHWAILMFSASKLKPQTSVNSEIFIPSYFWHLCCYQDTWRLCASSWRPAEWTQYPKTGKPAFTGKCKDTEDLLQYRFPFTDGATHRWTKRCTAVTMTWPTSCSGVRRHTSHLLLLATPSRLERRAWAPSSNSFAPRMW